jgi:CDP-diglyceride synthetase
MEWMVFSRLMVLYIACLVAGFLLRRVGPAFVRGGREAIGAGPSDRRSFETVKPHASIAQKFAVFFVFQVALIGFAFGWPAGLAVFLALLVALSAREVRALDTSGTGVAAWSLVLLFAFSAFLLVRAAAVDGYIVALTFLLVAVFDGYAQITGEILGGRKLVPRLSPGKTWSGLAGGLVFAAAVSVLAQALVFPRLHPAWAVAYGAGVGLIALAGDLTASAVKRKAGIKDFSNMLGPQGGILDRADSLIWLGPFLLGIQMIWE